MWRTSRRIGIAVVAASLVIATGCTSQGSGESGGNDAATLVVGARVDNNSFDTADLEVGHRVQYWQPVYDTLLRLDEKATPQANLATEWSYNEDNTELTLQLRDDVTFTDGEPFNADAVKANIEHLKAGSGQNQFMVAAVDKVEVVSDTEVKLILSEPVPALLSYLSVVGGAMASPAALQSGDLATKPVGSGPYVYDEPKSKSGTEYRYTRNKDYWNAEDYPYDAYVVRPLNDLTPTLNALKASEIDAAALEPAVAEEAEASEITLETLPVNWVGLVLADREGAMVPELGDPLVRQAINLAVDREGMLSSILAGYGESTSQPFNISSAAYVEDLDTTYDYDVDQAKKLMKQAGVGKFTLTMPQWDGPWNDLFPVLTDQMAEIGITVKWKNVPADQAVSEVLSGDYPAAFFPLSSASAWQDLATWVTPDAPWNMQGARDPQLQKLLDAAQTAPEDKQSAAFQAVNQWLVDEAWFAPFFRAESVFGVAEGTSVTMQAQNIVPSLWQFGKA